MKKQQHLKSYLPSGFEKKTWAVKEKKARLKLLIQAQEERLNAVPRVMVVKKIKQCTPKKPCLNEACPLCCRTFRKSLVESFVKASLDNGVWTRVSVIPDNLLIPQYELSKYDLKAIIGRLNKRIERSDLKDAIIIGGIDISFNTFGNEVQGWQLHLYFLINRPKTRGLEDKLRGVFNEGAIRSFSLKEIKSYGHPSQYRLDLGKAISYAYKNNFNRRSSYLESRLKTDGTPRTNVRSQPLKNHQGLELFAWLSHDKIGARLFLRNIKRLRAAPLSLNFKVTGILDERLLSSQNLGSVFNDDTDDPPVEINSSV